jgi:hypothetical protein
MGEATRAAIKAMTITTTIAPSIDRAIITEATITTSRTIALASITDGTNAARPEREF